VSLNYDLTCTVVTKRKHIRLLVSQPSY